MSNAGRGGGTGTNGSKIQPKRATTDQVLASDATVGPTAIDDPFGTDVNPYIAEDMPDYYAALHQRHWNPNNGAGSQFVDGRAPDLEGLLERAHQQRGSLEGDDRERLAELGTPPDAFSDQARYLLVTDTRGKLGTTAVNDLPDGTIIHAERTKPDTPCSLIVRTDDDYRPSTDMATIIVGPHPKQPGRDVVWTAHPGLPTRPAADDRFADGQELSPQQVHEQLGNIQVLLQPQSA